MTSIPLIHPDRAKPRFRPLKAWRHFRALVADKEDTAQVFHVIEALNGRALLKNLKNFVATPEGRGRLEENVDLVKLLDDHNALRKMPEGSVGAAYLEFMEREGLSARGLADEFDRFNAHHKSYDDLIERFGQRLRDTHDLFHVLTGYGRDVLGEACVLGFSHGQNPGFGIIFIARMGGLEIRKSLPKGLPVMRAINQARRAGKKARPIVAEDIQSLLVEPLQSARKRLGIPPPTLYEKIHRDLKAKGISPMQVMAPGG